MASFQPSDRIVEGLHNSGAGPTIRRGHTGVAAQPPGVATSAPHQASSLAKDAPSFGSSVQLPRLQLAKVPDLAPGMTEACERTPLATKLDQIQEEKEHFSQNDSVASPALEGRPSRDELQKASNKQRDADESEGVGIGLQNIRERLMTLYGGQAEVSNEHSELGGRAVRIVLPAAAHHEEAS